MGLALSGAGVVGGLGVAEPASLPVLPGAIGVLAESMVMFVVLLAEAPAAAPALALLVLPGGVGLDDTDFSEVPPPPPPQAASRTASAAALSGKRITCFMARSSSCVSLGRQKVIANHGKHSEEIVTI